MFFLDKIFILQCIIQCKSIKRLHVIPIIPLFLYWIIAFYDKKNKFEYAVGNQSLLISTTIQVIIIKLNNHPKYKISIQWPSFVNSNNFDFIWSKHIWWFKKCLLVLYWEIIQKNVNLLKSRGRMFCTLLIRPFK